MRRFVLLLIAAAVVTACAHSGTEPDEVVLTVYVGPQQVDCVGMVPQRCMLVRFDPNEPWQWFYGGIEGFTHEPGFAYRLLVLQRTITNPPQDGSSREWRLLEVLDKAADG